MKLSRNKFRQIIREEAIRLLREGLGDGQVSDVKCSFELDNYDNNENPLFYTMTRGRLGDDDFEIEERWVVPCEVINRDRSGRGFVGSLEVGEPESTDEIVAKLAGHEAFPDDEWIKEIKSSDAYDQALGSCMEAIVKYIRKELSDDMIDDAERAWDEAKDPYGHRGLSRGDFYESVGHDLEDPRRSAERVVMEAIAEAKRSKAVMKKGDKKASAGSVAIFKAAAKKEKGGATKKKRAGFDAVKASAEKWADNPAAVAQAATMVATGEPVVAKGEKRKSKK